VKVVGNVTTHLVRQTGPDPSNETDDIDLDDGIPANPDSPTTPKLADEKASLVSQDLAIKTLEILFGILSTIRDPDSIDDAKAIVQTVADDNLVLQPVRESAADTVRKVRILMHCPGVTIC
jgi:hypothetical protein